MSLPRNSLSRNVTIRKHPFRKFPKLRDFISKVVFIKNQSWCLTSLNEMFNAHLSQAMEPCACVLIHYMGRQECPLPVDWTSLSLRNLEHNPTYFLAKV